ncbi:type II toxin-antitoxin system RelE/ParE family toxin [Pseudorhodobacter sp. E13]|uniref:type II toxin-antitoxin system RelE/ParE family toxin n=1 Tax=Pseudorhodobacter sp. E13 TaxID=2487931 RepID=UPI000F8D659B|nr:type II toxin-antitoxin system RelE/ParE family toxin [Pseudorhodobacter sp. E13]RUS63645.1 type II toxin-antitoxin system RelE/ParE family toxin [Pseudorhodobacter sp. E13]
MKSYFIEASANAAIDDLYAYTTEKWGDEQADKYLSGLFARFEAIVSKEVLWRPVPTEFEIKAWVTRYEHHYIYWKQLDDGRIGIMAILHERMHQTARLADLTDDE